MPQQSHRKASETAGEEQGSKEQGGERGTGGPRLREKGRTRGSKRA